MTAKGKVARKGEQEKRNELFSNVYRYRRKEYPRSRSREDRTPEGADIVAVSCAHQGDCKRDPERTKGGISSACIDVYKRQVGARPMKAVLVTEKADERNAAEIAEKLTEQVTFGSNMRGSSEYRKALAKVLIRRQIEACLLYTSFGCVTDF